MKLKQLLLTNIMNYWMAWWSSG